MKIIVTRHGETEENKAGIIQGHLPGVLSKLGKEQAEKLAERLRNEKIDLIISSDLNRATNTAKIVAKFHPDVELILDKRLRERFFGNIEGKNKKNLGIPKNVFISDYVYEDNVVKNEKSFLERVEALIEETAKRPENNILLVGHNGICKAIIGNLLNRGIKNPKDIIVLNNTSVTIFEKENGMIKLKLLNCTEHLK